MQTIVGKRNIDEPKQSTIDVSSDCLSSKPKPTSYSIEIETTENYQIIRYGNSLVALVLINKVK